jgi:hypothetical protein
MGTNSKALQYKGYISPQQKYENVRLLETYGNEAVTSVGLTPFIRENDINFSVKSLKPDNTANIFFDEIKVNNFCQRASVINLSSSLVLSNLKVNQGLYGSTSKAYAEVLGTSVTGTQNLVYVNDNFITLKIVKGSGAIDLSDADYAVGDLVYQTPDNTAFVVSVQDWNVSFTQPKFTFLGKVKNWQRIDATTGYLVVDPILGTANTTLTSATSDYVWNLTKFYADVKQSSLVTGNNRFQAGETINYSVNGIAATTSLGAANAYIALSSSVTQANTINLRSIVLSTNNITRDGISTIVGNTISIVSGTNAGFKANVVSFVANTLMGWNEAIVDAALPAPCTSNSVYSIGEHTVNDVGSLFGILHVPSENNLRWLTGERVFTITDTATFNDNSYKMRAIAKYTAVGKTNTSENARNFVLREQTPNTLQAAPKVTQETQKVNDRKYMAQTFFTPKSNEIVNGEVKNAYGVFISSIDLYFKDKPTDNEELLPFTVAISKVDNGLPGNDILAECTLDAGYIKTSLNPSTSNAATVTKFSFTDPVYLLPSTEYAIKLITESPDYEVWTATLGGEYTDDTGNIRRISEQPYIGNFFKAQNASNWNPILNQDLMFRVNRASFSSSSSVYFNLAPKASGPSRSNDMSSNTVVDMIKLSSTEQNFTPTKISYELKSYLTDGTLADYINVNNNELYSFGKDTDISSASNKKRRLIPAANSSAINVKVTLSTTDESVSPILNSERFSLFTLQNIINNAGISNNLISIVNAGNHANAANIVVTISAPDVGANRATANVRPSMLSGGKVLAVNIINPGAGYFTTPTITLAEPDASSNATALINGETDSSGGNILAKYQTKIVTLEDGFDAGDLVVRMDAIKPSGTNIAVYLKVLSSLDSDTFSAKKWQKMTVVKDNISPNQEKRVPLEFRHLLTKGSIEYFDGARTMPLGGTFKYFAVKIRLTSEDPTVVPKVESMKVVAVPGG